MTSPGKIVRMKIYVGEDKRHGDVALYVAIIRLGLSEKHDREAPDQVRHGRRSAH